MTTENTTVQSESDREEQRLMRWRLILSNAAEAEEPLSGEGAPSEEGGADESNPDGSTPSPHGKPSRRRGLPGLKAGSKGEKLDNLLGKVYGPGKGTAGKGGTADKGRAADGRRGGLGDSDPIAPRDLGDVRKYFPQSVAKIVQQDALKRFGVERFLNDPKVVETLVPDVRLVATLISFSSVIPDETKETARTLVRKLVDDVTKRINYKTINAINGALSRTSRTNRPRHGELDFERTIKLNLKNWDDERKRLVVDKLAGFSRRRSSLYDVVICVDQSGSMASSVVYSSIFAATLGSIRSVSTRLVFFDTNVVDMTEKYDDPVDILFGAQLGGGTNIGIALEYCQSVITRPEKTVLCLISDFCDGGDRRRFYTAAKSIISSGIKTIGLLALDDEGAPAYDSEAAGCFAALGAPTFACTPDLFPELIAAAINGVNLSSWAVGKGFSLVGPATDAPEFEKTKRARY